MALDDATDAAGRAGIVGNAMRGHVGRISLAIAIVLAAVLLSYSVRGIDWAQAGRTIAGADPAPLLGAALFGTLALFMRAYRWRILLTAGGNVGVADAFWATAVGYFGNNFLPARGGEIVRTLMITSRSTLQTAFVLATALSERIADAIALVIISGAALSIMPAQPGWLAKAAWPFAVIGVCGAMGIAILPLLGSAGRRLIENAPVPHRWRPRMLMMLERGLSGIRTFHDVRRLSQFVALTFFIWYLDALGTVFAAGALGLQMPLPVALLVITGLSLGSALPSTPGYVGIYQFVAVTVLTPFGFSRTDAIAYILVVQALMYSLIGFWGALGMWRYRRG